MGKRMSELEKLARDICWAEWPRTPKDTTKAAYWRGVHPEKKVEYKQDAAWLVFIAKELKPLRILALMDFRSTGKQVRGIKRATQNSTA